MVERLTGLPEHLDSVGIGRVEFRRDPTDPPDNLKEDGGKRGWKKRKIDVNWAFNKIQDFANALLPLGESPEVGDNVKVKHKVRKDIDE